MFKLKMNRFILLIIPIFIVFFTVQPLLAAPETESISIFIRANQGFSFITGKITDLDEGDINILTYGIGANRIKAAQIAPLYEHFVEDIVNLPDEEDISWSSFADYKIGMVYSVKCVDSKYAIFELIDVLVSSGQVAGVQINYKHQPDGSRSFK